MDNKIDVDRAIAKLQVTVDDSKQELQSIHCFILAENRRVEYLQRAVKKFSEKDPAVLTVGRYDRTFIMETLKYIQDSLKDKINTSKKKVEELETRKLCVECLLLTGEMNLRKMVLSKEEYS